MTEQKLLQYNQTTQVHREASVKEISLFAANQKFVKLSTR